MCKKKVVEYYRNIVELNNLTIINGQIDPLSINFKFIPNNNTYQKGNWEVFLETFNMGFQQGSNIENSIDIGPEEYKVGLNIDFPYKNNDYKLTWTGNKIENTSDRISNKYENSNSLIELNLKHHQASSLEMFNLNHSHYPISETDIGRKLLNNEILNIANGNYYTLTLTGVDNVIANTLNGGGKLSEFGFTIGFRHCYYEEDDEKQY